MARPSSYEIVEAIEDGTHLLVWIRADGHTICIQLPSFLADDLDAVVAEHFDRFDALGHDFKTQAPPEQAQFRGGGRKPRSDLKGQRDLPSRASRRKPRPREVPSEPKRR